MHLPDYLRRKEQCLICLIIERTTSLEWLVMDICLHNLLFWCKKSLLENMDQYRLFGLNWEFATGVHYTGSLILLYFYITSLFLELSFMYLLDTFNDNIFTLSIKRKTRQYSKSDLSTAYITKKSICWAGCNYVVYPSTSEK